MEKLKQEQLVEEETPEELQVRIQMLKKRIRHCTMLALTALIAIIFLGIAWFLNNRQVSLNSIRVQASNNGFELASAGDNGGIYESILKTDQFSWNSLWQSGSSTELKSGDENTTSSKGNQTTANSPQINWLMTTDSNMENNENGNVQEDGEQGLYPGASGSLTFYVIPDQDGTLNLQFSLTTELYEAAQKETEDAIPVSIATDDADDTDEESVSYIQKSTDEIASDLVQGHLLFFETKKDGLYSDWIQGGNFSKTFKDAKADTSYKVTIYWVWPYVFAQTLLPKGAMHLNGKTILFTDDVRSALCADMKAYPEKYFYNNESAQTFKNSASSDSTDKTNTSSIPQKVLNKLGSMTQLTGISSDYTEISRYYNRADQYVGEEVEYILLRLNAQME
jgi:hypothetical protein